MKNDEILNFIRQYTTKEGCAPSVRDLCQRFSRCESTVHARLVKLKAKGLLDFQAGKARTLRVTDRVEF